MNTCKKCKFWTRDASVEPYETANSHPEYETARLFLREHGHAMYGDCSCPKFVEQAIPATSDGFSYKDYDMWQAYFITGQDFGCIHHEPKVEVSA